MTLWLQLIAASLVGSVCVGWLIYTAIKKQQITDVSGILGDNDEERRNSVFKIEASILSSLKLDEKYIILLRISAIVVIIAFIAILGPILGLTIIAIIALIFLMSANKLYEMKDEIDNLSYALYVINATYGRGLALADTFRELREANNDQVQIWTNDYLDGNRVDIPHRLTSLLDKMKIFEESGKNAGAYITSVVEQIQNKAEMVNSAIISIREVLPIKISFYGAVPLFMILSYFQAPGVWNGWVGGVLSILILSMFFAYNLLLKKITNSIYQMVNF